MLEYSIPQEYIGKVQEILSPYSIEVDPNDPAQLSRTVRALWQGLVDSSKSTPEVQALTFLENETMVQNLNRPVAASITNWLTDEKDTSLMLATKEGAVFCLSYIKVGDKGYVQWLTPENTQKIHDEQMKLLQENGLEVPREMTFFERIRNFFSEIFFDHPIEVAARREAYLKFYENAQKTIEKADILSKKGAERKAYRDPDDPETIKQRLREKEAREIAEQERLKQEEIERQKQAKIAREQQEKLRQEEEKRQQELEQQSKQQQELDQKEQVRLQRTQELKTYIETYERSLVHTIWGAKGNYDCAACL